MNTFYRALAVAAYLALIVGTNIAFSVVGPALLTFVVAGLTMAARDFVHDAHGRTVSFALVVVGAAISAFLAAPAVALASLVAFLLAETLDLLVYVPVRERIGRPAGIAVSGVVGSVVDSLVFLTIAFGSLAFFPAQVAGKVAATLGAAALVAIVSYVGKRR